MGGACALCARRSVLTICFDDEHIDTTGITVGEVEKEHSEQLRSVIAELCAAGEAELGVKLDEGAYERLAAYGRSVAHFPTAVKEFEWRNGWFHDITLKVRDACHTSRVAWAAPLRAQSAPCEHHPAAAQCHMSHVT